MAAIYFSKENSKDLFNYLRIKGDVKNLIASEYVKRLPRDKNIQNFMNILEVKFVTEEWKDEIHDVALEFIEKQITKYGIFETTRSLLKKDLE